MKKSIVKLLIPAAVLCLVLSFFGSAAAVRAEIIAVEEEKTEITNVWEISEEFSEEGYVLASAPLKGSCTLPSMEDKRVRYQVLISEDVLRFTFYKGDGTRFGFSNVMSEGEDAYAKVLYRTESGVYGMTRAIQDFGSTELILTEDDTVDGLSVNDFLLRTMESGESFDIWFSVPEWKKQPSDPYAVVHFTVVMDDPEFAGLLLDARADNWGKEEPEKEEPEEPEKTEEETEEDKSPSLFSKRWDTRHYGNSETGFKEDYYLKAEDEGIMVYEDLSGKRVNVDTYVYQDSFRFDIWLYNGTEWIRMNNSGAAFYTGGSVRTESGEQMDVIMTMESGGYGFYFDGPMEADDDRIPEEVLLDEMLNSGSVHMEISIYVLDETETPSLVHIYFTLSEHDGSFKTVFDRAEKKGVFRMRRSKPGS